MNELDDYIASEDRAHVRIDVLAESLEAIGVDVDVEHPAAAD